MVAPVPPPSIQVLPRQTLHCSSSAFLSVEAHLGPHILRFLVVSVLSCFSYRVAGIFLLLDRYAQ